MCHTGFPSWAHRSNRANLESAENVLRDDVVNFVALKASSRIVEEALVRGASVAAVAQAHGVNANLVLPDHSNTEPVADRPWSRTAFSRFRYAAWNQMHQIDSFAVAACRIHLR